MVLVERLVQDGVGIGIEAREDLRIGPRDPGGGVAQALAIGVLADGDQQLADGRLGAGPVDARRPGPADRGISGGAQRDPSSASCGSFFALPLPFVPSCGTGTPHGCCWCSGGGQVCPAGVVAGRHPGGAP